jgi:hypothetical protein
MISRPDFSISSFDTVGGLTCPNKSASSLDDKKKNVIILML